MLDLNMYVDVVVVYYLCFGICFDVFEVIFIVIGVILLGVEGVENVDRYGLVFVFLFILDVNDLDNDMVVLLVEFVIDLVDGVFF